MKILATGGLGYIGSHTVIELFEQGHEVVVVDNLINANIKVLDRINQICGKSPEFYQIDLRDEKALLNLLKKHKFDCCIHFAGLKAVGESVQKPMEYYDCNIGGTLSLLKNLAQTGCKNIIFSSSATVYGNPKTVPIDENTPKANCTNPYGWTKSMIEQILTDVQFADKSWNVILLRYFNPIGAHKSGKIGENPNGIPNNLMPYITQVAIGKREKLSVFGNDYDTPDGTGVRDYIHVVDLAKGHVKALEAVKNNCGLKIYNLGTGKGYSVLEVINAFEKASGKKINYQVVQRREGDVPTCFANPKKAEKELNWKAELTIDNMCEDAWNWQKNNPDGY